MVYAISADTTFNWKMMKFNNLSETCKLQWNRFYNFGPGWPVVGVPLKLGWNCGQSQDIPVPGMDLD